MDGSFGRSWRGLSACGTVVLALLGACASEVRRPVRPEFDLRDPSATRRLAAISMVERTHDRTAVPTLIELLDDDDDAVRMSAGSALRSITGHDTGYRAFAPPAERRAQVAQWRAWWNGGAPRPAGPRIPAATGAKDGSSGGGAGYTSGGIHERAP